MNTNNSKTKSTRSDWLRGQKVNKCADWSKIKFLLVVQSPMELSHVALANAKHLHLPILALFRLQNHSFSSGTISHASLPTSSTASPAVNVVFFDTGETERWLRVRFGEHRRSVINRDNTKPVARHFTSGNYCVSEVRIRALCPISGSNGSRKRQEMRLIHSLGTLHPSGLNERLTLI